MSSPLLSSKELFHDKGWRITLDEVALPNGKTSKGKRFHRCDSVHILAFTEEARILMLREYRPFYGTHIWMVPSGKMDKEQDAAVAAMRELREETGFSASELKPYFVANYFEKLVAQTHVFMAKGLKKDPLPRDEDEMMEVHELSLDEAIEKVLGSEYVHSISALALLRYAREHQK
jgi:ADP-ribose pyrophosphatase